MDTDTWLRFMDKVEITDSCWVWTAAKSKGGYGRFNLGGKMYDAHRLMLSEKLGRPVACGMDACHAPGICHNRLCVNPEHLREATRSENMADKAIDGTNIGPAKLTHDDVTLILTDTRSAKDLSVVYGVTAAHINAIRSGRRWH